MTRVLPDVEKILPVAPFTNMDYYLFLVFYCP